MGVKCMGPLTDGFFSHTYIYYYVYYARLVEYTDGETTDTEG